jgi:hypothetical protein
VDGPISQAQITEDLVDECPTTDAPLVQELVAVCWLEG